VARSRPPSQSARRLCCSVDLPQQTTGKDQIVNVEGYSNNVGRFTQTNDVNNTQGRTTQINWYKNDGIALDFQEIRWDNGTTQIIPHSAYLSPL
jgi:hypothetical protein